jgi:hypothetical protein
MKNKLPTVLIIIFSLVIFTFACSLTSPARPDKPSAATSLPQPTQPAAPTAPAAPIKPTAAEPPAQPTIPILVELTSVQVYLVALEDGGASGQAVGCGDSLVPVRVQIAPTSGVLRAALEKLLSIREQSYGESGLYNALYQSNLQVGKIELENGDALIHLSGDLRSGGVCDDPRILGQLTATASQFPTVRQAHFLVNGQPLETLLSGK